LASACHGISVDEEAVVIWRRMPVPVFDAVSVIFHISLEPVAAL
jgi:hypothetical protein